MLLFEQSKQEMAFDYWMNSANVAVAPGPGFGIEEEGFLRLALVLPMRTRLIYTMQVLSAAGCRTYL